MKKIFMMLLILFIIYIGIQLGFAFFGTGHIYQYKVLNEEHNINVKEQFINNTKGENNSYYLEIDVDSNLFTYQTYKSFNNKSHIVRNVIYYQSDEYKCILPIFIDNKIITDVMCLKNNILYNYHSIQGQDNKIDSFVNTLNKYGYDKNQWVDNATIFKDEDVEFYKDNLVDNQFLVLTTYKGIYTINANNSHKPKRIDLFSADVYKKPLSIIFENYYVVADYNSKYKFNKFYLVDISSNKVSEINCGREISFDSYIQGWHNNSIYFFDRDAKKQYEINLKTNKIIEVGNENTGIKVYRNSNWEKELANNAKNNIILFDTENKNDILSDEFVKIDKIGGNQTGYYYFYKPNGKQYSVYRAPVINYSQKTYLFDTTDVDRLSYYKDYVYYIYDDEIRFFNDFLGSKKIMVNSEFRFNKDLNFGVYGS